MSFSVSYIIVELFYNMSLVHCDLWTLFKDSFFYSLPPHFNQVEVWSLTLSLQHFDSFFSFSFFNHQLNALDEQTIKTSVCREFLGLHAVKISPDSQSALFFFTVFSIYKTVRFSEIAEWLIGLSIFKSHRKLS